MHDWECFGDHPLGRRMLLRQAEEPKRKVISLSVLRLRQVAPLLQAEQHPEYLGDGAVQKPCDLAYGQTSWGAGEEFQYIQSLFKRRRWIAPLDRWFRHKTPSKRLHSSCYTVRKCNSEKGNVSHIQHREVLL